MPATLLYASDLRVKLACLHLLLILRVGVLRPSAVTEEGSVFGQDQREDLRSTAMFSKVDVPSCRQGRVLSSARSTVTDVDVEQYGLSKLKELAAQNIKSQLTSEIAFSELLSRFTAR